MSQINYTFKSIANRPKQQLSVLAKTNAIKHDFSKAFNIDTKPKKTNSNIDSYYDALTKLEYNGPKGLTARTNNPVATLYTQELAEKFGATKGPALPSKDNPENRALFTAVFPDIEKGTAAGKYIVKNIYNNAGGDVEKFASIYSMGKLPNQLIDSNEIAIKDRYVKALMSSTSKDDLAVTLKRQEDDVSQAVIDETERLKTGDDLFKDSSDISRIFDPTTRMLKDEPADITAFSQPSTTKTRAEDPNSLAQFEESVVPIIPYGEGIKYSKEFTQLEEQAGKHNARLNMSNAPETPTGVDAWKTYWSNTFGANPEDDTIKALAVNTLAGAAEIVVGFSDLKDKAIKSIATGEGGLEFAEEFLAGFAATPEILGNLITATGYSPDPTRNRFSEEGMKLVKKAQGEVWRNPLLPFLAATGLKAAGQGLIKAPKQVRELAIKAKKQINELVSISETALKIAKKEVNKADYSFAVNKLAEAIKNPAVYENTLNLLKEGKSYDRATKKGYSSKQINAALKEVGMLAETYFETINSLQNPYVIKSLTGNQKIGLQNSSNQLKTRILEQARIVGDDATITQLQGGFGLFKPDAKVLLEYIKGIKKELPDYINKKIIGYQKKPDSINPNKKLSTNVQEAVDFMKKTDHENKVYAEMNKPTLQKIKGKLAKGFYDISAEANFAIDRAIKSVGGKESAILARVRMEKDLISGTSARAEYKINQVNSTLYEKLNKKETSALNELIMIRRERSLKKHHDAEAIRINKELLTETKKSKIKELKDELKRITVDYDYSGGKAWRREGIVKDWLAELDEVNPSKISSIADDYFNVYRGLIDDMENAGLINKTEAIRYRARDYSPKEYLEFIQGQKTYDIGGKQITVSDNGIKRMRKGSEDVLNNNTRQLLFDSIKSIDNKITNNKVNNLLSRALENGEIEGIGYLLKNVNSKSKPGYVRIEYFKDGVKKAIALDESFASGWLKSDAWVNQKMITIASWLSGAKIVKAAATGLQPLFAITNMAVDMAYTTLTQHGLYSNNIVKAYFQMGKDMAKVSKDAGRKNGGRKVDYINEGGMMTTLSSMGKFGDPFKPSNTKFGNGVRFAQAFMGKIGEWSELTTRLAIRERGIRNGLSPKEATYMARNYLDFSKQGQITRSMEAIVPYSSASVQASRGLLRSMNNKDFYWKAAQIATYYQGLKYFIDNSKEAKETFGRISDDIKFRNFIIPLPFKVIDKTGKKRSPYLKIKKDGGQSLITSVSDLALNLVTKERSSDYNVEQLKKMIKSFTPYEIARFAPTINVLLSWGVNRKFPWASQIYRGDDKVTEGREMTNLDEELIWRDIGNNLNVSPAKLQYTADKFATTGNFFVDVGFGSYDYIRNQMSEEELSEYDRSFQKYIDMPMSDIPGIRKIPGRFLGFADDVDVSLKEELKQQETDKANIIAANNNEISSFLFNYRHIDSKEGQAKALKDLNAWRETIRENFGEGEAKRIKARFDKQVSLDDLDLVKGLVQLTINESPAIRAYALAYEMVKYKDNEKTQFNLIAEIQKISPIVKNKRTGYLNSETILYYNAIMDNFNKEGILKNPIFIDKHLYDKAKAEYTEKKKIKYETIFEK